MAHKHIFVCDRCKKEDSSYGETLTFCIASTSHQTEVCKNCWSEINEAYWALLRSSGAQKVKKK